MATSTDSEQRVETFPPRPVLVVVEARVDPAHEDEFNRWYDDEHMPDALACPGFRAAARYRTSDGLDTKYISLYIVDDESTMSTPEIKAVRGFAHLSDHVQYERRIYRPLPRYAEGAALGTGS